MDCQRAMILARTPIRAINCEGSGRCPVQPRDQCAVVVLTLIDHPLFETETLLEPC
uniref:Uncharacterized protein n=1 Tax=Physcomitrium patens TaxID=3218 RepID=A0A2K1J786_PHYPA|nr:hypothetical protein PHYPA_020487 [Physcomitrium patens]